MSLPCAQSFPPPRQNADFKRNTLRLLLITDAWFPQVNGVVRTLSTTTERLKALGHEVEVLAPERFHNVPCPTYPEIRLALCTPARVGRIIREAAPDAIHIATEGPLGMCARWWLSRRSIGFTTSFHTLFPQYLNVRFRIPERWTFKVVRRFHDAATATMYSTPTLRAMFLGVMTPSSLNRFMDHDHILRLSSTQSLTPKSHIFVH